MIDVYYSHIDLVSSIFVGIIGCVTVFAITVSYWTFNLSVHHAVGKGDSRNMNKFENEDIMDRVTDVYVTSWTFVHVDESDC